MKYQCVGASMGPVTMTMLLLAFSNFAGATELEKDIANPSDWASQAGDYANHRYSTLDQITATNVGSLSVAWTMSTGVLRGHEGHPSSSATRCTYKRRFRTMCSRSI